MTPDVNRGNSIVTILNQPSNEGAVSGIKTSVAPNTNVKWWLHTHLGVYFFMQLFTITDGCAYANKVKHYPIPINQLKDYYDSHWFLHLSKKTWFTKQHFFELLEIAKQYHPNVDFSKHVWDVAQQFLKRDIYNGDLDTLIDLSRLLRNK